jgi:hypothetical protein
MDTLVRYRRDMYVDVIYHRRDCGADGVQFYIMDAVRISDDLPVVLKRLDTSEDEDDKNTDELDTTLGLLGETAGADPSNPCMRAYEIFTMPDGKTRILVTPLLRPWESPVFETIGEVVDFFGQVLDVSAYLG